MRSGAEGLGGLKWGGGLGEGAVSGRWRKGGWGAEGRRQKGDGGGQTEDGA